MRFLISNIVHEHVLVHDMTYTETQTETSAAVALNIDEGSLPSSQFA